MAEKPWTQGQSISANVVQSGLAALSQSERNYPDKSLYLGLEVPNSYFVQSDKIGLPVDFNQGLDARRITEEVAQEFKGLRIAVTHGLGCSCRKKSA